MPFDGLTAAAAAAELNEKILDKKISRIYQPLKNEINIFFADREKTCLKITADPSYPRMHLTEAKNENPLQASSFCMVLRKHLAGGIVKAVRQDRFDRTIIIEIESFDQAANLVTFSLITEIMGRHSNIILVSSSGRIIDAVKHVSRQKSSVREVMPSCQYINPPNDKLNPLSFDRNEACTLLSFYREKSASNALLSVFMGLSPALAASVLADYGLDPAAPLQFLSEQPYPDCCDAAEAFFADLTISPVLYYENTNRPKDFSAVLYSSLPYAKTKNTDSISKAAEAFYSEKNGHVFALQQYSAVIKHLNTLLSREKNKLSVRIKEREEAESYELSSVYGNLILTHLGRMKKGEGSLEAENYLNGETVLIPLAVHLTPAQNAQKYFKKFTKDKNALVKLAELIKESEDRVFFLESQIYYLSSASSSEEAGEIISELTKHRIMSAPKKKQPHRSMPPHEPAEYESPDGYKITAGRNNRQNDNLTFRSAGSDDIWLHAKNTAGSHVILKTESGKYSEEALLAAASAAAYHSGAKESENVPVDYTYVRYVKKPSGAAAGRVIYTNQKTVYVSPMLPDKQKGFYG